MLPEEGISLCGNQRTTKRESSSVRACADRQESRAHRQQILDLIYPSDTGESEHKMVADDRNGSCTLATLP